MMLCSQLSLSKPLQDHLATHDWSMGTMVTNREYRGSLKGVAKTIIAPFGPKMRNNRGVLCWHRFPLTLKPFWIDQRVGLIYKLQPYSTRFEITILYRIQHFNENAFVTRVEFL